MSCDQSAVLEYRIGLNNSQYPESFPKSFELDSTILKNKILIIEYSLPTIEDLIR